MADIKQANQRINNDIQNFAELASDPLNISAQKHLGELMVLAMPKLRFFIWKFFKNDHETDDVLHNTLEKICINLHTYDSKYRFLTWAFNISKNEALTYINEKNQMPKSAIEDCSYHFESVGEKGTNDITVKEAKFSDLYTKAMKIIYDLPENEDKYIIIDVHINKMKGKEIAKKYNMNPNTVKTRLKKTRKKIKDQILKDNPDLVYKFNSIMEF